MSHWPIVSIIHGLLTPLLAIIRRNLHSRTPTAGDDIRLNEYFTVGDDALSTKVQTTFALLQQTDPTISTLYRDNHLWETMSSDTTAADLEHRLHRHLRRQRAKTALEKLGNRRRRS